MSVPIADRSAIATTEIRPRINVYSTRACPSSRRAPTASLARAVREIVIVPSSLVLDRRLERGRDLREDLGDVGADRTQKRDRDDRDQAQDQRVLHERLALFPLEAGAQADEEALHRDHLLPTSLSDFRLRPALPQN